MSLLGSDDLSVKVILRDMTGKYTWMFTHLRNIDENGQENMNYYKELHERLQNRNLEEIFKQHKETK